MIPRLGAALLHFLWQGTLLAGLYAIARGQARSAVLRYGFACAALAAMAVAPIATYIASAPPELSASHLTIGATPPAASAMVQLPASAHAITEPIGIARWIVAFWIVGALAFLARFLGGWLLATSLRSTRARPAPAPWQARLNRLRTRLRLTRAVSLLVSGAVQTPTVVGYLRPLILLPAGALTGLAPEFLEALLAHELAHIRRHDYLAGILQGIVEALLFYHPAVWWISSHIREERENCCDDIAVELCGNPVVYAGALAAVEASRPAHAPPALAASGASLPARIARLLGVPRQPLPAPRTLVPIGVACLIAGLIAAPRGGAQSSVVSTSALPTFEVASIRPSDPETPLSIQFAPGGRLVARHATLRFLIKIAYDVSDDQITGGPSWLASRRFDIQAKPDKAIPGYPESDPAKMTKDELLLFHQPVRLRLQRLLAERFGLQMRKESRPMPILAMVIAKNGPKLKPAVSSADPVIQSNFAKGALRVTGADMDALARTLSEAQPGHPVVNMTALQGKFDFQLDWTPEPGLDPLADPNQPPNPAGGISIFTALQQQLGLKLEPRQGSADTLIVTAAQLPSEN